MMMRGEAGEEKKVQAQLQREPRPEQEWSKEEKSRTPNVGHGAGACPTSGWEYLDPKGRKQGPFSLEQMMKWHDTGVFKATLPLRCDPNDRFIPLKDLFPHPMVPFLRAPKRPT